MSVNQGREKKELYFISCPLKYIFAAKIHMWQRIQTVYMLLAFLSLALFNFFSLAEFSAAGKTWSLLPYSFDGEEIKDLPLYFIRFGGIAMNLLAVLVVFMITRFNNRRLQIRLGNLIYFFALALTVVMYLNMSSIRDAIEAQYAKVEVVYTLGSYLPVIAIAFLILANRSIRKDEKLIKSLDRIR